jgi:hypothetical protein
MSAITDASSEQSTGIGHVNMAITEMDSVTQQNAAGGEAAAAAGSMQEQAATLAALVARFARRRSRAQPPAPPVALPLIKPGQIYMSLYLAGVGGDGFDDGGFVDELVAVGAEYAHQLATVAFDVGILGAGLRFDLPHFLAGAQRPDVVAAGQQFDFHIFRRHLGQFDAAQAVGQALHDQLDAAGAAPEVFLRAMNGERMIAHRPVRIVGRGIVYAGGQQQWHQDYQILRMGLSISLLSIWKL